MIAALLIIEIVVSAILLVVLYLQSGKVKNVGSAIIGTKDVELFETMKYRGFERFLHITTIVLVIVFIFIPIIILTV